MPSSEIEKSSDSILCAKCRATSRRSDYYCQTCGSHLHIHCIHCGKRNVRVESNCAFCGRKIRDPVSWQRGIRNLCTYRSMKSVPMQIILGILVALVVFRIVLMLASRF